MTLGERILAVYHGNLPDKVPFMLDLSHWFYHRDRMPWDLSRDYQAPEVELIDYHKRHGIGFYIANNAAFYAVRYPDHVGVRVEKSHDQSEICWTYETPIGAISRRRRWEETSYSWAMAEWGIKAEEDLKILGCALGDLSFSPLWDHYQQWVESVGEFGVVYIGTGYSGFGQILNYWAGVEGTSYAIADWPKTMRTVVDQINQSNLRLIDLLCTSPAEIVIMGDNFSADIQPPRLFNEWSGSYYSEAVRRLHAAGKYVAVHVDGRLRGALRMIASTGADCADAVTPAPMGDLWPDECRLESGPQFILSGGVPPNLWLPEVPVSEFRDAVLRWLDLRKFGPRFIAAAGDQVPPGAEEGRIFVMRDLVEKYGSL